MVKLYGVPKSLQDWWNRAVRPPWSMVIYRLLLVLAASILVAAAFASGILILGYIAAIVVTWFLAEDVQALASDLWNARWAELNSNLFG